jgi:hydrogenase maturation protease
LCILVAGVGNVLKGDDGFGVRAAEALRGDHRLPAGVLVLESGIGGMHLVQELMQGYDAVLVFDAFDRDGTPGQLFLLEPELPHLADLSASEHRDYFAETHYAVPLRALTLAREIGALPPVVRIIGCQPVDAETFGVPMHEEVAGAIGPAVDLALEVISRLLTSDHSNAIELTVFRRLGE